VIHNAFEIKYLLTIIATSNKLFKKLNISK